MLGGVKDVMIISTPEDKEKFQNLFGDGSQLGINVKYEIQEQPKGIAEAYIIGEKFLDGGNSWMILGDNLFYGKGLSEILRETGKKKDGATIFGYHVKDPERSGVIEFDESGKVLSIEEKPKVPKSNYVITGLYFCDSEAVEIAKNLKPSGRMEKEISDLNRAYFERGKLEVKLLGRGFTWLDTGTHESMADATNFIRLIEERQGLKIGCIEESAHEMGYIDDNQLRRLGEAQLQSGYGQYILNLLKKH
jgi:glucose-1-phosphate thymidylyltransferase